MLTVDQLVSSLIQRVRCLVVLKPIQCGTEVNQHFHTHTALYNNNKYKVFPNLNIKFGDGCVKITLSIQKNIQYVHYHTKVSEL